MTADAVTIAQRLYRGDIDTPKTRSSRRTVAIPTKTASLMLEWMGLVSEESEAWVFFSENAASQCGAITFGIGI